MNVACDAIAKAATTQTRNAVALDQSRCLSNRGQQEHAKLAKCDNKIDHVHSLSLLSRRALMTTVNEDSAMAAPANMGERRMPATG